VAHTADVVVEAWAPDLGGCLEEAVAGLVAVYAEVDAGTPQSPLPVELGPGAAQEQLLVLLDEVVFVLDTAEGVPVAAEVRCRDDGGLDATLWTVPRDRVVPVGSVPKAIARSELAMVERPGHVWCRYLVDV
jgi:SHS2 domain-containing protein